MALAPDSFCPTACAVPEPAGMPFVVKRLADPLREGGKQVEVGPAHSRYPIMTNPSLDQLIDELVVNHHGAQPLARTPNFLKRMARPAGLEPAASWFVA